MSAWQPFIGEHLEIEGENSNAHDRFAVAVIKVCPARGTRKVVGHIPREISNIIWHFLSHGGEGKCIVTEKRRCSPLVQGLEVPCCIRLSGKKSLLRGCKEVYRFPHTTYPYSSCICSFLQQHPYFLFIFKNYIYNSTELLHCVTFLYAL